MKRIISIIALTAMFTAIAVGLAGCGVKTMTRILIGLEGYIMALISTRADGEYSVSETVGLSAYQRQ